MPDGGGGPMGGGEAAYAFTYIYIYDLTSPRIQIRLFSSCFNDVYTVLLELHEPFGTNSRAFSEIEPKNGICRKNHGEKKCFLNAYSADRHVFKTTGKYWQSD